VKRPPPCQEAKQSRALWERASLCRSRPREAGRVEIREGRVEKGLGVRGYEGVLV
jgi:hypothetical protein